MTETEQTATVAALSTPRGRGGIAVIRVSGPQAVRIAAQVFFPTGRYTLETVPSARLIRGAIRHEGQTVDDGLAAVFRAPHSYTGEDMVELNCHGGILLSQLVLEALFAAGAEPAGPGEFTKRAFLAGKLSLSQAEAVIDVIDAETTEKLRLSAALSGGVLYRRLESIAAGIRRLVADIYVYIDYPDEDMTEVTPDEALARLRESEAALEALAGTYHTGRAICEGIETVICGKPNTGKSSLLNLILGEERAIVTEIAGTTRDTVEETAALGRVLLRLCDTAGLHEAADEPERLGIRRSREKMAAAGLILAVFDGSAPLDGDDEAVLADLDGTGIPVIALLNKSDRGILPETERRIRSRFPETLVVTACGEEAGASRTALGETIDRLFCDGSLTDYASSAVITRARVFHAVTAARDHVRRAIAALESGLTQDIAGMDLELALSELGEADGRQVTEQVVDDIFHRFCIGK